MRRPVEPPRGLLASIIEAEGTADERTTTFEYDTGDNLTATVDPLDRRIEYAYDSATC